MPPTSPPKKRSSGWRSLLKMLAVVFVFRAFVAEAYVIPSGSMIPTLQVGDRVWVNRFVYGLRVPLWGKKLFARSPAAGEIVVFVHPKKGDDLIKRVVGVAGDTVEVRDGAVLVNGVALPNERMTDPCSYHDYNEATDQWFTATCDHYQETIGTRRFTTLRTPYQPPAEMPAVRVPEGAIFVMGDNRDNSSDSRYWGFVPLDHIKGRAMFVSWSAGGPDGIQWHRFFTAGRNSQPVLDVDPHLLLHGNNLDLDVDLHVHVV